MNINLVKFFAKTKRSQLGASMIEYVMLVALISLVAVGGAKVVGSQTFVVFDTVQYDIKNAAGSDTGHGTGAP